MAQAVRLKGWQGAAAIVVAVALAGTPKPAVPRDADDMHTAVSVDAADIGAAEALAIDAVLRLERRGDKAVEAIVAT